MRRGLVYTIYLIVFIVLLVTPTIVRRLNYYGLDGSQRQQPPDYEPENLPALVPTPAAGDFSDNPQVGQGLVLLDEDHGNEFDLSDISYLDSRLSNRGYELIPYRGGDLANALRPAGALVVIAPLKEYTASEILTVIDFVERGGRLLLVGDPTRFLVNFDEAAADSFGFSLDTDQIPLNSLANAFDLVFNGDYLYNTVESEGNFRNIILTSAGFAESDLTEDVERLAFYGSHSIQVGSKGQPLLSADDNTWSSATDRPGGLVLAAMSGDGRVLGVGDLDFLAEPYYTVYDNSAFIAQIADFLAGSERLPALADFPYFLGPEVALVYSGNPELGPDAFDEIIALQEAFRQSGKKLNLAGSPIDGQDVIYAGLYNQAEDVAGLLEEAHVSLVIDPAITEEAPEDKAPAEEGAAPAAEEAEATPAANETPAAEATSPAEESEALIRRIESDLGSVQMSGTALLLLSEENGGQSLVVLAASAEGLENTLNRLIGLVPVNAEESLSDCLVQGNLALCPTGVAGEAVELSLETGGAADEPEEDQPEAEATEVPGEETAGEIDADEQGAITLGESVSGTLEENQAHAWIFSGGPAVINIVLEPEEDLDGVLSLYGPDGQLMGTVDSAFTGEDERIVLMEIPDDGDYSIVVRDFFDDGGSYSLTVESIALEDVPAAEQGELPFDEPVEGTLEEDEAHAWTVTVEDPLAINLYLTSGELTDGVLLLFDPDGRLIKVANNETVGGDEQLEGIDLDIGGVYTVVVGEFLNGAGEYTLLLEAAE